MLGNSLATSKSLLLEGNSTEGSLLLPLGGANSDNNGLGGRAGDLVGKSLLVHGDVEARVGSVVDTGGDAGEVGLVLSTESLAGSTDADLLGGKLDGLTSTSSLKSSSLLLLGVGLTNELSNAKSLGVRVEGNAGSEVGQGVELDGARHEVAATRGLEVGLNLVGADEAVEIGVGHGGGRDVEALLASSKTVHGAEDVVEGGHSGLGPHNEATKGSTRGKLEEVEGVDVGNLNTGDVTESLGSTVVLSDDDQGATLDSMGTATRAGRASAGLAGSSAAGNIREGTDLLEGSEGSLSLGERLDGVVNDEGNLVHVANGMAARHHERGNSGSGESRSDSVALGLHVGVAVPAAPCLGGGEETTTTAHVTESTLARAASTTTRNTGDTSNGTTSAPRLGRVTHTSAVLNGVGLATVLGHVGVNLLNDIRTDRGSEHGRGLNLLGLGAIKLEHRKNGTNGGH